MDVAGTGSGLECAGYAVGIMVIVLLMGLLSKLLKAMLGGSDA